MSEKKQTPFYITTPIYYVNDIPHIGHAYTTLAADVLARFMRLDGYDVFFLTGTDEHGQKVEQSAAKKGIPPQQFTDEVSKHFRDLATSLQFSNDDFIRTTEIRHRDSAQALWKRLEDKGAIYLGSYSGWYSIRDEAYYNESELVDGKAPSGASVEWVEEPSYFFNLSAYQEKLLDWYETHPNFIFPDSRRNEVIRFVEGGLKDLSISRTSFSWGVPVPGSDKHIMYVWLDALANYLTAVGFPNDTSESFQTYWCGTSDMSPMHIVGKDILRFHAVYWPAFLMAADLPLPSRIVAHGWWTNEGEKISKSVGNVISPFDLLNEFGLDQTRYFLMREVPFGNDGNYSRQSMINRINSELANNLGNLVQRTLSMVHKNCAGVLSCMDVHTDEDQMLLQSAYALVDEVRSHLTKNQQFSQALQAIFQVSSRANEYIDSQAPWTLKKEGNIERMGHVLYVLCETIRILGLSLQAFIPQSAEKILNQLMIKPGERTTAYATKDHTLKTGITLLPPQPIFPRFMDNIAPMTSS